MSEILEEAIKAAARAEIDRCMETLYAENPALWPYGLKRSMFDRVHLVEKDGEPAGFVGWQTYKSAGVSAGYPSWGILPEYRGQGLAKQASRKLLDTYGPGVDKVAALIVEGNEPSEKVARSLNIAIERPAPRAKEASSENIATAALAEALSASVGAGLAYTKEAGLGSSLWKLLRSNASKNVGAAAAGVGGAALENQFLLKDEVSDNVKHVNLGLGALTGLGVRRYGLLPGLMPLTAKQLGLLAVGKVDQGVDAFKADAPMRAQTAANALEAAKLEKERAAMTLSAEKDRILAEKERLAQDLGKWSTQDKILASALGLSGIGLGLYGYNSLKGRAKKPESKVVAGDPTLRRKNKVKIEIPADALGNDFFDHLRAAESSPKALTTATPVNG